MHYELRLNRTASGAGYFACLPPENSDFDDLLEYLKACPLDDFMHKHLLSAVLQFDKKQFSALFIKARADGDRVLLALLYEACLISDNFSFLRKKFKDMDPKQLSRFTPMLDIRSEQTDDRALNIQWVQIFKKNIIHHQPLLAPAETGLPPLFFPKPTYPAVHLEDIPRPEAHINLNYHQLSPLPLPHHTARHALNKLESTGVITGVEMRHIASLSPWALLREWHIAIGTKNGRHDYTLAGSQMAYGKGLSLDDARASYAMEIVERCSAFAGFGPTGTTGYKKAHPLTRSTFSALTASGMSALDPNKLSLEVPYTDEPIWWIQAQTPEETHPGSILIPAQCVFLFCNLDETSLFSGLGSTGLAAGNSMEEARLRALFETIERDCEAISLYLPSGCFTLTADDPEMATLLADYRAKGIFVQFQDMTSALGVPCYKCFVIAPDGAIIKGSGAHLDGRRALIAALTETPWPYPKGPPSAPFPGKLPMAKFEDLPDYSSGNATCDLQLLENLLSANGVNPVYVDLTREDLNIPVVRALVPGFELMADFDRFSRVSPRLFANYRQAPLS